MFLAVPDPQGSLGTSRGLGSSEGPPGRPRIREGLRGTPEEAPGTSKDLPRTPQPGEAVCAEQVNNLLTPYSWLFVGARNKVITVVGDPAV